MRPIKTFFVQPCLPSRLEPLEEIAYNLRWSWDHETIALFRRLDRELWEETEHNPVLMLGLIGQERLQEVSTDEAFLAHLDRVREDLEDYVAGRAAWFRRTFGAEAGPQVAYFSMEFGISECLPIYSGGLGFLAGDHLKSASDLGLPLVGVGLLYQKGYFRQYLSQDGWQQERYPVNDFSTMPVRPLRGAGGEQLRVSVDLAGRPAVARLWRAQVGRILLVLLDTNVPENPADLRDVTDELYGGDLETRIRQEIMLGIGGEGALVAAGIRPRVYHMNEGHCAFLTLERARGLMTEHGLTFEEAYESVSASTLFTTHTPVPAGIDVFRPELIERYFGGYWQELGLTRDSFLALGRLRPGASAEEFNMAVLALRTSSFANGVSHLHARVSRSMWSGVWPGVPKDDVPITTVTNGVHAGSWISDEMRSLYDRYLGPRWSEEPGDTSVWKRGEQIPRVELWRSHERRRERLVAFARRRLREQLQRRGAGKAEVAKAEEALDPEALTIGFGRRFAPYKRATLLLRDLERLDRILNATGRPVQIVYAGKAHPKDDEGKALIQQVIQVARRQEFRRRIVFLEDYDAVIARYLVQGVDVWLNTPRRPMEASGTSGMKAAFNGGLNLSILDGWWDEACTFRTGWAIGKGEEYADLAYQDTVEAGTLYDLLEREVVPLFYTRGSDGLPRGWIDLMMTAMSDLCPIFNTNRMVCQYVTNGYAPAQARWTRLEEDGFRRARDLARWRKAVLRAWSDVRIERTEVDLPAPTRVGGTFEVRTWIQPGPLEAADLQVEVYLGRVDEAQQIVQAGTIAMEFDGQPAGGEGLLFRAQVPCMRSGTHGLTVRVLPHHADLERAYGTGLIVWGS